VSASPARTETELTASADGDGQVVDAHQISGAQVVDRVADILEAFLWLGPELGVSELARAIGLTKATAHRLLSSLRNRELVAQDPITRRYRLGMRLWELGTIARSSIDWLAQAKPELESLAAEVGETAHLAVLDDDQVLYVDKVESSRSLRMPSQVGRRLPAHCTGVGKALIAFLPDERLAQLIEHRGLQAFTPRSIVDPDRLRAELASVRKAGYATDNEEIEDGLRCIAAPVRDHSGTVIAALSIAGPSSRLPNRDLPARAARVTAAAAAISARLGYPGSQVGPRMVETSAAESHL
jgi:DNA-binding IclR family transcriptional regulator